MYTIEWKGSPHFTSDVRPPSGPIDPPPLIVLHTMAGSLSGTLAHFQNPQTEVSSHYGVGRKGEIHQYVKEKDGAWTNGRILKPTSKQIIQRSGNPNRYTITIEFEGKDRGGAIDPPQYQAGLWLIAKIAAHWNIPLTREYIIGHYEIDSINKENCPGSLFPLVHADARSSVQMAPRLDPTQQRPHCDGVFKQRNDLCPSTKSGREPRLHGEMG